MRPIFKTLSFLLFWLFMGQNAAAQHPVFYTINDENGLPSNEVYQIIQDDFGYIWIGCDGGLLRYDGFVFQSFTSESQYGHSMSGLSLDQRGWVWCRNFKGQLFRTDGDSLRLVWDHYIKGPANSYALDKEGHAWVSSSTKIEQINENGRTLKTYPLPVAPNANPLSGEIFIHKNYVYFTHPNVGVARIDLATGGMETLEMDHAYSSKYLATNFLFFSYNDSPYIFSKDVTLTSNIVMRIVDKKIIAQREINNQPDAGRFYIMGGDHSGKLWLCTINGVYPCSMPNFEPDWSKGLLVGQQISNFLLDREGNYWFSSLQNGIFVVPSMDAVKVDAGHLFQDPPPTTTVTALPNGKLLAGTFAGDLLELDLATKETVIKSPKNKAVTVKKIRHCSKGVLVSRGLLSVIEPATGKEKILRQFNARDMVLAGDTLFIVSPYNALKVAYSDAKVQVSPDKLILLKSFGGWAIEYDSTRQTVWLALNGGLFKYKNGVTEEVFYNGQKVKANALSEHGGIIWLATQDEGLLGMVDGKVEYQFSSPHQLKEPMLRCVKAKEDCIYTTSGEHFYKIYYKTGEVQTYGNSIGINPRDISDMEVVNGQLCLATNKGVLFLPSEFKGPAQVSLNIRISQVSLGGAVLPSTSNLELPYHNTNFKISFSSTCFRSRGKFTYRYRMLGLDSNWTVTPASNNAAVYASIPPGQYEFQVQSMSDEGERSGVISINVHVGRPYWQKWWFYVLVGLAFAGIVFAFFQIRIRVLQRRAILQNQVTASHLTALKAQMNPHFMYNALNSIQDLVLQKDIQNANQYLSKFSNLMRKVLDASSNSFITIKEEIDILGLYLELEKLRFGEQFIYTLEVAPEVAADMTKIPSMIVQPYVENALKHGLFHKKGEKKLDITFKKEERLVCTIVDNGIGRKRATEIKERKTLPHKSFATRANQKRFELIGKYYGYEIEVKITDLEENGEASGTKVEIFIPPHLGVNASGNHS